MNFIEEFCAGHGYGPHYDLYGELICNICTPSADMDHDVRISNLVTALRSKLSEDEFFELFLLMDGDPPAGPLYCAVNRAAADMRPNEFDIEEKE